MVDYNGVIYTYMQNYQGDILGLLDSTGAAVVTYSYDAWGRLLATGGTLADTLGKLNPFRYRGYVYDEETGLYYLRSRYYNPEWGRFISSDALLGKVGAVGTHNLFAYCGNEPVNYADYDGNSYNPLPFRAEPFAYYADYNSKGEYYERWYDANGYPFMERHHSDHNGHSNPHDHFWNNPDPSQPPRNEHRILVEDPPERWPGQDDWEQFHKEIYGDDDEQEQEDESSDNINNVIEGAVVVGAGYLAYWGIKGLIAMVSALPTYGYSMLILLTP